MDVLRIGSVSEPNDISRYFSGTALWGDDFEGAALDRWHEDERTGYSDLVATRSGPYSYAYHALNARHAFRWLPSGTLGRVLGLGSGAGHELDPVAHRVVEITIVDTWRAPVTPALEAVPIHRVPPEASGTLPFANAAFDTITCFGVLHHIPNVSHVLGEIARVLRPGGHALIREPIVSMGDWRQPRPHLTRRERGLPLPWVRAAIQRTKLRVVRETLCVFPFMPRLARAAGIEAAYNHPWLTALDELAATAFRWNWRYHATRAWHKIRPTSVFLVLTR